MGQKNIQVAQRLASILTKLNRGDRLSIASLAEEFHVAPRTIRRDLTERLLDLDWKEEGPKYYSLSKSALGQLYKEDIERFAHFASIQNLFPKLDREFFKNQLIDSIYVKGLNYEDVSHKTDDFKLIQQAIEQYQYLAFTYLKNGEQTHKDYRVEPYVLLNRHGIWYLIASDQGQIKTFCFSQISKICVLSETFTVDPAILEDIKTTDSIYYGNQLSEVKIEVKANIALYFKRRDLLPNQSIIETRENGDIIVMSENVNDQEILSLMRYWIPHVKILSPEGLQTQLNDSLREYLEQF